jgi:hypothetical protein
LIVPHETLELALEIPENDKSPLKIEIISEKDSYSQILFLPVFDFILVVVELRRV